MSEIPVIAGDWKDDDGKVIASLIPEGQETPEPSELPFYPVTNPVDVPVTHDRLLCRTWALTASNGPAMLLPADTRRKSLTLSHVAGTALIAFGATADDVAPNWTSAGTLTASDGVLVLDSYTGAVWCAVASLVGADTATVSVVSVTR